MFIFAQAYYMGRTRIVHDFYMYSIQRQRMHLVFLVLLVFDILRCYFNDHLTQCNSLWKKCFI